jgi:cell filamentation protein
MSRYEIVGGNGSHYEPGSNNLVLKNRLGITLESEIVVVESLALADAKVKVLEWFEEETVVTTKLICDLHKIWLGSTYSFAGQFRTVNMSKPGVMFSVAEYIPRNMETLEKDYLRPLTPCKDLNLGEVCDRVSKVHAELLLIHPFREGNGRLARWIADLMVLQAGFPAPNYDIYGRNAESGLKTYFSALRSGFFSQNTTELSQLFRRWVMAGKGKS